MKEDVELSIDCSAAGGDDDRGIIEVFINDESICDMEGDLDFVIEIKALIANTDTLMSMAINCKNEKERDDIILITEGQIEQIIEIVKDKMSKNQIKFSKGKLDDFIQSLNNFHAKIRRMCVPAGLRERV